MSLYAGYFASRFNLDPMGTEEYAAAAGYGDTPKSEPEKDPEEEDEEDECPPTTGGEEPIRHYQATVVAKSFINGIPNIGRLTPFEANQRLLGFAKFSKTLDAFNQDPDTDAKDGKYRLYTKKVFTFSCKGYKMLNFKVSETDMDGGREGPGIYGTINIDQEKATRNGSSHAYANWRGYGRPNLLAEPGMQAIKFRTSVNIWHKPDVLFSCKNGDGVHKVISFRGSKFPSRKLWINGVLEKDIDQGALSDLWKSAGFDSTFVAE